jgi:3-isopropylmalate/(R)-2-methylmalate dehydratase small subunit
MTTFSRFCGVAAPLDRANVDTGQIFPSRFLRKPRTAGLHQFLFRDLRYDEQGNERPDFILNRSAFRNTQILVTQSNFGCGSSREWAVHAFVDSGIRCIIAPSFGEIFQLSCYRNGLLPIVLPEADADSLRRDLSDHPGTKLCVDLDAQTVEVERLGTFRFQISPSRKSRLKSGLDDCALALEKLDAIKAFADAYATKLPWSRLEPNSRDR